MPMADVVLVALRSVIRCCNVSFQFLSGNDALFRADDATNNTANSSNSASLAERERDDRRSSSRRQSHSDSKFESGTRFESILFSRSRNCFFFCFQVADRSATLKCQGFVLHFSLYFRRLRL
jgi:hypothetical protein